MKKHYVANALLARDILKVFLHENSRNYTSYNLVANSLLFPFSPFLQTKNKNQVISKLVVW